MTGPAAERTPASSMSAAIGAQIRLRRTQRGMTSAELARRAGISKATLSNLEAGTGNPTIGTIDALAIALRIPITDLMARDTDPGPIYIQATEAKPGEVTRELLRRISGGHSLEIWRMRIPPNSEINGLPHATGTVEHLLMSSGRLTAGSTDNPQSLGPGDMLAFAGDAPHVYRTGDEGADVTVVFASPLLS
ncbi:helix-turn-helix domain-containing protein [Streptomyces hyaluromycini]|uniref:Helix-turn-helix domain-containing protein n=1 Tax=Streptomyces hyaluromycini TaxID=1377993 RepID=A0ABV1WS91_9ACTN|nr:MULTISPECIES: helix-turn-helix domain-containing protein [Streptomyces]